MRVLHLSHFDRRGGACIAAYRQHQSLLEAGVDSVMWVRQKVTNDPHVFEYRPQSDTGSRVRRIARRRWLDLQRKRARPIGEIFDDRSEHGGGELLDLPPHDLINVQFSQGFVDLPALLSKIAPSTPIVFTLHEMSMFTGGCSYSYDCRNFESRCGHCPQLKVGQAGDFTHQSWLRKRKGYGQKDSSNLHFAADSNWLAGEASQSSLLQDHSVSAIHYGIDTSIFKPRDMMSARDLLGLPPERAILAFCAASIDDPRKGIDTLAEALCGMDDPPFLLTWGSAFPKALKEMEHLHLGAIDAERLAAIAYSAADFFVIPSKQEAFGQTALEALACGRAVIGSNVGGIPDMVVDGENGLLVSPDDKQALRAAVTRLCSHPRKRIEMGLQAREAALNRFTFAANASAYLDLYSKLLNSKTHED